MDCIGEIVGGQLENDRAGSLVDRLLTLILSSLWLSLAENVVSAPIGSWDRSLRVWGHP